MSFFTYCNSKSVTSSEPQAQPPPALDGVLPAMPREGAPSRQTRSVAEREGIATINTSLSGASWDPLRVYMREACTEPLLTRVEEDALALRIRQGDEAARERMILSNLRLVIKIAGEYEGYGLPKLDMINLGNIGLMRAVDRFEPDRGAKFSTYAVWWIRQSIFRGLSDLSRTIRIPAYKLQQIGRLRRAAAELESTLGRDVSAEEIAEEAQVSAGEVKRLLAIPNSTIPLDGPTSAHNEESLGASIADDESKTPSALSERRDLQQTARRYLDKLNPREREILSRRFGLDGQAEETLEDIGADFGVTRERIRQIEARALLRLRKLVDGRPLDSLKLDSLKLSSLNLGASNP